MKNKLTNDYLFLCDEAFVSESNKLNIIGIFQNINVPLLPFQHLKMVVVGKLNINDDSIGTINMDLNILDPNSKPLKLNIPQMQMPIKGKDQLKTISIILTIGNVLLEREGKYTLQVLANKEKVGETFFEVKKTCCIKLQELNQKTNSKKKKW